jgi:hypothetical protein
MYMSRKPKMVGAGSWASVAAHYIVYMRPCLRFFSFSRLDDGSSAPRGGGLRPASALGRARRGVGLDA